VRARPATLTRRALLRAAAAGVGLWGLAGCGQTRPEGAGSVVLHLLAAGDPAFFSQMLPRFEASHPGVRVQWSLAGPEGRQGLVAALLSGSGPDVFWDADPSFYLGTPLVLDLAPLVQADGYPLDDFGETVLAAFRFRGGLYMLPRSLSPAVYAVRPDVLAAAGAELPGPDWSHADLVRIWRTVAQGGKAVGGQLVWSPTSTFYLQGWGAHLVDPADPERLRCALDTPAALACAQWMWDRFWQDGSAQGLQGQSPAADFFSGTLAMQVVTAAGLPAFAARASRVSWQLLPFPRWPAGPATSADTDFYAVAAATRHPRAAWQLLQFLVGPEGQQAAVRTGLQPPSRKSLWPAYLQAVAAAVPPLARQPLTVLAEAVQQGYARPPERFRYQQQALAILQVYWQQIFGPARVLAVQPGLRQATAEVDAAERAASRS
jgi:multiple sugar transport system substrate-binding protein